MITPTDIFGKLGNTLQPKQEQLILKSIWVVLFILLFGCKTIELNRRAILQPEGNGYYRLVAVSEDDFFRAAFEICKQKYQMGYSVVSGSRVMAAHYAGVEGNVQCYGPIDPRYLTYYNKLSQDRKPIFRQGQEDRIIFTVD